MKLYCIAGEASGDLHGSNLIKALKEQAPQTTVRCWGGERMEQAGGELVKHYKDLAFMGFWEVLKNLRTILGNLEFCKKDILAFRPDALILIDYPGFNLRIAKWARQQGIPVIYYISPQIWAWHRSRVHDIRRDVDKMLVILPFEQEFYRQYGMEVEFVGHPLLDALQEEAGAQEVPAEEPTIALLPGSRRQEVKRILPRMLSIVEDFPAYRFVVAGASGLPADFYQPFLEKYPGVSLKTGQTYALLRQSQAALVKSGTSTLETALLDVPQVVCYAGNPLSYLIARWLVEVPYISLVNLISDPKGADREHPLVRELIQGELNRDNLRAELKAMLDPEQATRIKAGYAGLRQRLGEGGASRRAARVVLDFLEKKN